MYLLQQQALSEDLATFLVIILDVAVFFQTGILLTMKPICDARRNADLTVTETTTLSRLGDDVRKSYFQALLIILNIQKRQEQEPEKMRRLVLHYLERIEGDIDRAIPFFTGTGQLSSQSIRRLLSIKAKIRDKIRVFKNPAIDITQEELNKVNDMLLNSIITVDNNDIYMKRRCDIFGNITPLINYFETGSCPKPRPKNRSSISIKGKGTR